MKRALFLLVVMCMILFERDDAVGQVHLVGFSPAVSSALNLGTEIYPGDHAQGLSPLNETAQPNSTAFGNVFGAGMNYNIGTNVLSFDFAYGSAFGFSDLVADFTAIHIHGNGANNLNFPNPNASAGVLIDLLAFHTPSGPRSGRVTGSVTLSATQETWLLDHQLYVNIHSTQFAPGEIRGQLVLAIPEPGTLGVTMMAGLALSLYRRRA